VDNKWRPDGNRKNGCYEIVDVVGATGPGLVATKSGSRCMFFHLSQLRTICCCGWQLSFECPSHIGRLAYLTCMGSGSFRADLYRVRGRWSSKGINLLHRQQCWDMESEFEWGPRARDMFGKASLICAFGFRRGMC
jgi:hypothetical protein